MRLVVLVLTLAVSGATRAATLEELELDEPTVQSWIVESVLSGVPIHGTTEKMKQLPPAARGSVVQTFGEIARRFLTSEDFRARYAQRREESKPVQPEATMTTEELRAHLKKQMQDSITEMEKNAAELPQEYRDPVQVTINESKKQLATLDDPNNALFSKEVEAARMAGAADEKKQYLEDLALWEKDFPADPAVFVAAKLRWALEETKDIDHAATLADGPDGIKVFSDPAHEARSPTWKLGYRVGKESVDAARAIATTLLQEMQTAPVTTR